MLNPASVASLGVGDPVATAGLGLLPLVVVVSRDSGGGFVTRGARNAAELRRVRAQIEREDEEILAIVIAAVHAGLIP
ncbi:MAG: hypothetical protein HQL47_03640 [Gammaproteobacteria bacterium]|nr:hypothetical protein [Gammaproteobacteria bacterium]